MTKRFGNQAADHGILAQLGEHLPRSWEGR